MKKWLLLLSGIAATLFVAGSSRADISTGVISYWPLDEIDGAGPFTTPDFASSNVVVFVGNISLTNGVNAAQTNAFFFPTSPTSYFTTAGSGVTPSGLPIYKSPSGYTISMWVKAPAQTTRYLYTESANVANQILGIGTGTTAGVAGKIDLFLRTDGGASLINHTNSVGIVFDNTWHHIAFTDQLGACVLYIDGNKDTNFTYTRAGVFSLTNSTVGNLVRNTLGAAFNGSIDNVAVWARPLSQAEVQNFMSNSIPLPIVQSKPSISTISSDSTNFAGDYIVLNVSAVGSTPITYQWYLNGVFLSNQTNTSITNTTLTTPGTNVFSVVSSNFLGSITNTINVTIPADPAVSLTNGLVSYWPLDNINNTTTTPDLFSRNDFTLVGTNGALPTQTTGQFGNGLAFDGTQLEAGRAVGLPVYNRTNYSVSMWVQGQPGAQLRVFGQSSTNAAGPLFTIATDPTGFLSGTSIFIRNDAGTALINNLSSSGAVFDGNWHHIVWVDQNGHALLYIDGVLDTVSFSYARTGTFALNTTSIGATVRSTIGNAFTGNIDDVAVWSRRLSYSEITALQTTTIPAPTSIIPASVFSVSVSPADPTNNLFAGDTLTFTGQATGTAPLAFQWLKNGVAIPGATNPTLSIPNAQVSDSGGYSLNVTNGDPVLPGGASSTSAVIQATVIPWTAVTNGLALALDFDAVGLPNPQPGFQAFNLGLNGTAFTNAVKITITNIATSTVLADRLRTVGPNAIFDGGGMTQARLYNDFVFCNVTNVNSGLSLTIERLAPNTSYGVTIWSYDPSSLNTRISDWTEVSSGSPIVIKSGYTFNGSVHPVVDYDGTFGALLTSSAAGKLQIQGVNDAANVNGVASFINAIQLVANPTVSAVSGGLALDGNLQVVAQAQFPGETIALQFSPDLSPGSWQSVTNATTTAVHGPFTVFEVPHGNTQQFFRAVATHP